MNMFGTALDDSFLWGANTRYLGCIQLAWVHISWWWRCIVDRWDNLLSYNRRVWVRIVWWWDCTGHRSDNPRRYNLDRLDKAQIVDCKGGQVRNPHPFCRSSDSKGYCGTQNRLRKPQHPPHKSANPTHKRCSHSVVCLDNLCRPDRMNLCGSYRFVRSDRSNGWVCLCSRHRMCICLWIRGWLLRLG